MTRSAEPWRASDDRFHGYKLLVAHPAYPELSLFLRHANRAVGWDVPGGLRDGPDETPEDTALRELWQETGLIATIEGVTTTGEFTYLSETRIDLPAGTLIRHIGRAAAFSDEVRFDCGPDEPEHLGELWLPTRAAVELLPMRDSLRRGLAEIVANGHA